MKGDGKEKRDDAHVNEMEKSERKTRQFLPDTAGSTLLRVVHAEINHLCDLSGHLPLTKAPVQTNSEIFKTGFSRIVSDSGTLVSSTLVFFLHFLLSLSSI